ncbi:MAG: sigma-70 family RNA polymerase sigma factor [Ruminococcaceae bacterium]|nr:sigma-70 family RNA polymerase sigma factor [Oscillospiraceae bacterium]
MEKEQLVSTVTAAQNGDNDALNTLFNEYYNDLYYFALKTIKDEETALDVTQEAFVEIINTLGNLKEPAAFVTWAKQITYHQCTRYFKKKKDVLVDEDEEGNTVFDALQEENTEFIPDEALDKADFKKTVIAILDKLSEEQRSAAMMYYFDEMSVRQIAEIQGVSEGTVKSRLNYARKSIKESVEEYEKKNGIKLHAIPLFPLFGWLFKSSYEGGMPLSAAKVLAEGIGTATGSSISVATATTAAVATTATTATAVGIGAKIAALPLVTKVVAGIVAVTIAVGGGTAAVIISQNNDNEIPANNQNITSSEDNKNDASSESDNNDNDELILEGIIPDGCTYTLFNGTVLNAGEKFPENCTAGDKVAYADYLYGYECVYTKNIEGTDTWHMWKDGFDSGDSGVIESDVFGSWSVMVADQTKKSYSVIVSKINGKPIKTLYGTFFGCTNMTEAPEIPSTITAMPAAYLGCSALKKAPIIPKNVQRIMMSFKDCTSLTGDVVINAELDKSIEWFYSDTFSGTAEPINLTGETPEENLILIARLSDNEKITVNGKAIDRGTGNDEEVMQLWNYTVPIGCQYLTVDGKVYNAGAVIEAHPENGDKFITDDYTYTFGEILSVGAVSSDGSIELSKADGWISGWAVRVNDKTKTSYSALLADIGGYPLRIMTAAFANCTSMKVAPKIPESVISVIAAFLHCHSLEEAPELPPEIHELVYTFSYCKALRVAPKIPDSVYDMQLAFLSCKSLVEVPVLPDSINVMHNAFSDCTALESIPNIPANAEFMNYMFDGCTSLKTIPAIPKKAKYIGGMFRDCTSLTGNIEINANITDMEYNTECFTGTVLPITLKGTCPILSELAASANNGNITLG